MKSLLLKAVALVSLALASGDMHVFGVGGKPVLCVPQGDTDSALLPYADESINLQPGAGRTPGFAFLFGPAVAQSALKGWYIKPGFSKHPYANTLSGTVSFLGRDDRERFGSAMRARSTRDEWFAQGQCPDAVVKKLQGTGTYEVKCSESADYGSIWNRAPSARSRMPNPNDLVLATCNFQNIEMGPYVGRALRTCSRIIVIGEFMFDYRFQEENAWLIPEMDSFLQSKLEFWKRDCRRKSHD